MSDIHEKLHNVISAVSAHMAQLEEDGVTLFDLPKVEEEHVSLNKNDSCVAESVAQPRAATDEIPPEVTAQVSAALQAGGKRERIQSLQARVQQCAHCAELVANRTQVVFGAGTINARLCFVGEAPGRDEDIQGVPFVGRAGQLLTKMIESIGLKREHVFIANVLKCRPPQNRNPRPEEIVSCQPYLKEQLDIIQPKVICALGTFAAQTLLNTKDSISRLRGSFHEYNGIKLLATFHPAFLLRSPDFKKHAWEDMKKIRDELLKK